MSIHPQIIEKDGRKGLIVLPDEDFAALLPRLTRSSFRRSRPPVAMAKAVQLFPLSSSSSQRFGF